VNSIGLSSSTVAVELSIQGTFAQPLSRQQRSVPPNGAKLDIPGGDFSIVENGKINVFNCHVNVNMLLQQMGAKPDFASALKARAAAA
jgi:hypothetical protein